MSGYHIRNTAYAVISGLLLSLLQACSPGYSDNNVASAYETSDAVAIKPYTRTIFSSSNF